MILDYVKLCNFTFELRTMKKRYIVASLFMAVFLASPADGQNRITMPLEPFVELYVTGGIDVELIPSDAKELSITSRNGQPEEVNVEFKNNGLYLKIRPKIVKDDIISVKLPYSQLLKIDVAAGAVVNSARDLVASDINLVATSGGKIEISLAADMINAKVVHVSDIVLYGKAESQEVSVNTGGNYLAYDLDCKDSYVKVSSGAQAKVTASRLIEATANSKGFIGYIGDPETARIKTSLGGEIISFETKEDANIY